MWIYLHPSSMSLGSAASDLSDLRDYAFAWALVDVETSGLVPRRDRVLSVAVVTLDADGEQTGAGTAGGCGPSARATTTAWAPSPGATASTWTADPGRVHGRARHGPAPWIAGAGPGGARVLSPGGP